jgi:MFS family permease
VFAWGAVAPDVRAHAHWPEALVGAVFSATPLGYGTATVFGGRLADRLPPKRLCAVGVALLMVGFAVAFVRPSPLTFVLGYAFLGLGLGGGLALTASIGAAVQAFPERAGSAGGALTGMYALGAVIHVPIVGHLVATVGWLDAIRLVGSVLAGVALLSVLLLPSLPAPTHTAGRDRVPALALLRRPSVWTGVMLAATATPLGSYAFVNAGQFALAHGFGTRLAGVALIAVAVGNAFARPTAGVLADARGANRVLAALAIVGLVSGPLVATALAPLLVAGAFGAGFALGGGAGVLSRLAAEAAPDAPHSAFGLLFAGYAAGALIGPLAGPLIGSGAAPWVGLSLVAVVGLCVLVARVRLTPVRGEPAVGLGPG